MDIAGQALITFGDVDNQRLNDLIYKEDINIETDCNQTSGPGREVCNICLNSFETEPKIRCAECSNIVLCLQCFSLGLETQNHRCDHAYHIDRRHIPTDPNTDWSHSEDFDLLQALIECGYGNYTDLGKRFMHRTIEEIRTRSDEILGLDKAPARACQEVGPRPVVKYNATTLTEDPPRYPARCHYSRHVAGYCAPRGDFDTEYLNNAEEILGNIESESDGNESDSNLADNLTCALVECYNDKLRERARRKRTIKEHALLLRRTPFLLTNGTHPRLLVYMQLLCGEDFDSLMESLNMEVLLLKKFRRLKRYRELGIKRNRGCAIYNKLDLMRCNALKEISKAVRPNAPVPIQRKGPSPIDISQFNGYEALSPGERNLCATLRLLPEIYIKFKTSLVELNNSDGGVRLMTARQMFKIDVNKTRKIFNYLRDENIITAL